MRAEDEASILACIPSLRRYARGLTGDPHRADDLVQDTLERAWSRYSRWQRRGELRAWMFGIMHNHFIDGVRAHHRQAGEASTSDLPDVPVRATQTDHLEVRDLDRCLQGLPPNSAKCCCSSASKTCPIRKPPTSWACPSAPSCRACRVPANGSAP